MSLARNLFNGGQVTSSIDPSKYDHENGVLRIALESREELHDLFLTSVYESEQVELEAISEGVEVVQEAGLLNRAKEVGSGAKEKAKKIISNLWEKLKALFHSIVRFFDSMTKSGKEFVIKYKSDIEAASGNLKDYNYEGFNYSNIEEGLDKIDSFDCLEVGKKIANSAGSASNTDEMKKLSDKDAVAVSKAKSILGSSNVSGVSDLNNAIFAYFRSGAKTTDSTTKISITSLSSYANTLENSNAAVSVNKCQNKLKTAYDDALRIVDQMGKDASEEDEKNKADAKVKTEHTNYYHEFAAAVSTEQVIMNQIINGWKDAVKERDAAYRKIILGGLSNAKKSAKG